MKPGQTAKVFRTPSDLAVNGAPPALVTALHVGKPHVGDRAAFLAMVEAVLDRAWLTNNGPLVQALERQIEAYLGVRHCVSACNGTVALQMAVRALGLTGEIIVPSYTFIATASALEWLGLTPVFADIDPATHNLDPAAVRRAITPRTSAILGVHLWGRPAPVAALEEVARAHGLALFFDAAHAFGTGHAGRMIGGFGACEVLSFHATKFFNTMEGGAVVTDDDALAERLRLARNFGFAGLDNVVAGGINGKLAEVNAAMGLANLPGLPALVATNRENHEHYAGSLDPIEGLTVLPFDAGVPNNYQYVVVEVGSAAGFTRDRFVEALRAENVLARKYFWPALHRMPHYRANPLYSDLQLPATEAVADRVVVLPTGPEVGPAEIDVVASVARMLRQ